MNKSQAGMLVLPVNGYMYSWDYDNHLIAISKPGAGGGPTTLVDYVYDALGRRVMKTETVEIDGGGTDDIYTRYYYDGWRVLAEAVSNDLEDLGDITYYAYGNALDEVLFYVTDDGTAETVSYLTGDHLNSPAARLVFDDVTEQYQIAERYEYDAYGKRSVLNADYSVPATVPADITNIGFTGQRVEYLDNANLELSYYKNRWYSPNQGRFLSHDQLGYIDSMCLYLYVKNMPIDIIDEFGFLSHSSRVSDCISN